MIHLRGHSTFSMLEAIGLLPPLLSQAQNLSMSALGLTEYYFFSGALQFYQQAKKKGIKPIIGTEIGFVKDLNIDKHKKTVANITLIAKNYTGYQQLLGLTSFAWNNKIADKPTIDLATLRTYSADLYVLCGGEKSIFGQMIAQKESLLTIKKLWMDIYDIFANNMLADIIAQSYKTHPILQTINETITDLSLSTTTPLLVHNNFHYIHKEDKEAFEIALAIKDGAKMYENNRRKVIGDYHLMTDEEIISLMIQNGYQKKYIEERIVQNMQIAETIALEIPFGNSLFPNYQTPSSIQSLYNLYQKTLIEG